MKPFYIRRREVVIFALSKRVVVVAVVVEKDGLLANRSGVRIL